MRFATYFCDAATEPRFGFKKDKYIVDIINCTYIQLENRKAMSAKELINGLKIYENSYVY